MAGLEGLTEEQSGQWLRVAWFIFALVYHRREERALMQVVLEEAQQSKFRERERVTMMGLSIADQLRAEGEAQGAERTLRSALRTVLTERFGALPPEIDAVLLTANLETMSTWLRDASTAETLAEVGILPSKPPP